MIKAVKQAIVAILGNSEVTDKELMTAFTGAEALINSRPSTYQSEFFKYIKEKMEAFTRLKSKFLTRVMLDQLSNYISEGSVFSYQWCLAIFPI